MTNFLFIRLYIIINIADIIGDLQMFFNPRDVIRENKENRSFHSLCHVLCSIDIVLHGKRKKNLTEFWILCIVATSNMETNRITLSNLLYHRALFLNGAANLLSKGKILTYFLGKVREIFFALPVSHIKVYGTPYLHDFWMPSHLTFFKHIAPCKRECQIDCTTYFSSEPSRR